MLSENIENLVQTILSRCVIFRVNPFRTEESEMINSQAQMLVRMILNREPFYLLNAKIEEFASEKKEAAKLLDSMELIYRHLTLSNNILSQ